MKVGYLGPKGTFSYEICNKAYEDEYEKIPFRTIKDIINALENNLIEEAIVPIENSLQGCVTETIDTLIKSNNIYICGEEILKISQNLMAKEKYKFNEIKQIYSHPQALAQCREYLQKNFKEAFEDFNLSTKIVFFSKDELCEFLNLLVEKGLPALTLQYAEAFGTDMDPRIYNILQKAVKQNNEGQ